MSRVRWRTEQSEACPGRGPARITLRLLRRKKKRRSNRQPPAAARGRPRPWSPPSRLAVRGRSTRPPPVPGRTQPGSKRPFDLQRSAATSAGCGAAWPHAARPPTPVPHPARACAAYPPARAGPVTEARLARPPALAGSQPTVAVLLVRAVHPVRAGGGSADSGQRASATPVLGIARRSAAAGQILMRESLPPYIAKPCKEGGKKAEGQAGAAKPHTARSAASGEAL